MADATRRDAESAAAVVVVSPPANAAPWSKRLAAAQRALRDEPVPGVITCEAAPASRADVERVHAAAYVDELERLRGFSRAYDLRAVLPGSMQQIYLSAGAALTSVTKVCAGRARRAFALCEPPGHHAEADRSMGFCALDNVAIAAAFLRAVLGFERILIVDWDVHHGNGTQHAFEASRDVLFFDVHQSPHFPHSGGVEEIGVGEGRGYTINVPLPEGMTDADYAAVVDALLRPASRAFRPDFVLVSAGFDAHDEDSLGGMRLTSAGFANLCAAACAIADESADGRLVMVLEGGYRPEAVAASFLTCVRVLAGAPPPPVAAHASEACARVIDEVRRAHAGLGLL